VPLLRVRAILGQRENSTSLLLPAMFSSSGSQNVYMDRYARVRMINGYAAQGSAVTTNTGSSATNVRALFPYRLTNADGTITRQLIGVFDDGTNEYEIFTSTDEGANWTFREDQGSGPVNIPPDFCQFGNSLFIAVPTVAPRVWNGTAVAAAGGSQSPAIASVVRATGGNLSGQYRWKLVSLQNTGLRDPGSAASTLLIVDHETTTLTWDADSDSDVVGYEIYRTTGSGTVYYFVTLIDGRTSTEYVDNISDTTLLERRRLQEHGDAPPSGSYFCESHKQRVFWGRTNASPRRASYSDPGTGDSVYSENNFDFTDAETMGDFMTGMTGDFNGQLVVWEERSVWTLSGTGQLIGDLADWNVRRTNADIGSVSHRTVIRVPKGAVFYDSDGRVQTTNQVLLAYLTPLGDIRLFDGDSDQVISPLDDTINLSYQYREKSWAIHDLEREQITWVYPAASATEPNEAVTWNYKWGVWYTWTPTPWAHGTVLEGSAVAQRIVVGESARGTGGITYLLWSGNTFNGTNIDAIFHTKPLFPIDGQGVLDAEHTHVWTWVDPTFEVAGVDVSLGWYEGWATDSATAAGTATLSTAGTNVSTVQIQTRLASSAGDYLHEPGIRLRFRSNANQAPWSLEGFTLAYTVLDGLARRLA
jgi:hypothetical protein